MITVITIMWNDDCKILDNLNVITSAKTPQHQAEHKMNLSDILHSSCSQWFSTKREANTCRDPLTIQDGCIQTDLLQQPNYKKRQFCPICDDSSDTDSGDSEINNSR